MITLDTVLGSEPVLAGSPILRTPSIDPARVAVRWVHSSEVVDVASLLRGGELLLTAGSILLRLPLPVQREYLENLAARRVAALALETAAEPAPLADELAEHADALGLPLIELRETAPFVAITEHVNRLILAHRAASDEVVDRLSSRMARHLGEHGPDLDPLLEMIADEMKVEVVLTGDDGLRLGHALPAGTAPAPGEPDALAPGPAEQRAATAIMVGAQSVAELELRTSTPHGADLPTAADRLSSIVSLALLGTFRQEPRRLADHQLLTAVVDGAPAGATARAWDRAQLDRDAAAAVAVVHPAGRPADAECLSTALRRTGCEARSQRRGEDLVLLVTAPTHEQLARRSLVTTMAEGLAGREMRGALGPAVTGPTHAHTSCVEALEVLRLVEPAPGTVLDALDHLDVRLFAELDDPAFLEVAVQDCVGAIADWDRRRGTDLLHTLDVWLGTGCSATRAAAILHIERQSVHKRIAKALELLGRDPRTEGSLFTVHAAVRAARTRAARA